MTQKTVSPADALGIVGVIDPDAYAAGTYTTGWIAMTSVQSLLAIVMAGDLGSSATLDAKLQQATNGSGAGVKDVTGAAITQLTQAGSDSNKQAAIALYSEDLDVNGGFTHVRLSMTIATAASDAGAIVIANSARIGAPVSHDLASVDELVRL